MRKLLLAALLLSGVGVSVWAQTDSLTAGNDPGRTGWMKDEKTFTTANVKDMKLLWKIKLDSAPREMHNLYQPLIARNVTTPQGPREMAVVASITDHVFGIDVASGEVMWSRTFDNALPPETLAASGRTLCPGGQTAVPTVVQTSPGVFTIYAVSWDGRLRQLNLADGKDVAPAEKFMPPNGKPYALNIQNGVIYTASAQGCGGIANAFYSFDIKTRKASVFTPAGGGMWGRRGVALAPDGTIYLGTGDGNYNPETRSLGNAIVAAKLDANQQLQIVDWFAPPNANWMRSRDLDVNVSPMAFDYQGRKFLVGTSKECVLWLLDRDALGGENHRTALHITPHLCNDVNAFDGKGVWGSMAAWVDSNNNQWVVVPFWGPVSETFKAPIENGRPVQGGVGAYKVEQRAGKWQLTPAWLSRDMNMAEEAVVANGIVFAYGSGEDTTQAIPEIGWDEPGATGRGGGGLNSGAARRIPNSTHATLFALDALTGKELWNSGNQITSWNHFSGLTVANGRAYIGTYDGMLYCFGVQK